MWCPRVFYHSAPISTGVCASMYVCVWVCGGGEVCFVSVCVWVGGKGVCLCMDVFVVCVWHLILTYVLTILSSVEVSFP